MLFNLAGTERVKSGIAQARMRALSLLMGRKRPGAHPHPLTGCGHHRLVEGRNTQLFSTALNIQRIVALAERAQRNNVDLNRLGLSGTAGTRFPIRRLGFGGLGGRRLRFCRLGIGCLGGTRP